MTATRLRPPLVPSTETDVEKAKDQIDEEDDGRKKKKKRSQKQKQKTAEKNAHSRIPFGSESESKHVDHFQMY